MQNKKIKIITRTAILLALTLVFQMMGRFLGPNNNFIVGPLVNAALIIATAATGLWGGTAISVIAPFVSALTNKAAIAPIILAFSPFIAAGNFILVLFCYLFRNRSRIAGIVIGAVLKFGFLFTAIMLFTRLADTPSKVAASLVFLFGWPQLVTALIGGAIALAVIRVLGKNLEL